MIPGVGAMLWIKNRSALHCWVRLYHQPDRWLLASRIPSDSSAKQRNIALQEVVELARNCEWNASCAYQGRDAKSGQIIIGLISDKKPQNLSTKIEFTRISSGLVLRASGQPRDEAITVSSQVEAWSQRNSITPKATPYSITAQSFQCWEWPVKELSPAPSLSRKLAEKIFELRDIAFYPLVVTPLTIAMLGTGSTFLFGMGIFSIILLSGAHKFVFLHQREDATQERHLQNY